MVDLVSSLSVKIKAPFLISGFISSPPPNISQPCSFLCPSSTEEGIPILGWVFGTVNSDYTHFFRNFDSTVASLSSLETSNKFAALLLQPCLQHHFFSSQTHSKNPFLPPRPLSPQSVPSPFSPASRILAPSESPEPGLSLNPFLGPIDHPAPSTMLLRSSFLGSCVHLFVSWLVPGFWSLVCLSSPGYYLALSLLPSTPTRGSLPIPKALASRAQWLLLDMSPWSLMQVSQTQGPLVDVIPLLPPTPSSSSQ